MAAGVGETYRMLLEGRQAQEEGKDVGSAISSRMTAETTALAEGLEVIRGCPRTHGTIELEEMDVDAVIWRAPELALIDELAHTNAPGMRNEKRWQDIEEVLDAGIDVISTVNVQHLESSTTRDLPELTDVRARDVLDRILDEADEVVLVDLSPEELQERIRAGKVYRRSGPRSRSRTSSRRTSWPRCVSSPCARWPRTSRPGARSARAAQQGAGRRRAGARALVEPQPKSQRILRRAWRSCSGWAPDGRRLGAPSGRPPTDEERRSSPPYGGSRSSASTFSRRRATTSSQPCAASPHAARPTSSSAR
jgi:two-component system sensor histidine kinase KdpD